jgi:hypothetical protein
MAKMSKASRNRQRAQRKSDRAGKRAARDGGTDMAGLASGVLGAVGTFGPMVQDIGKDTAARMDERGVITHDADVGGKTMGGAQAGLAIGQNFGPVGAAIGAAGGAILGLTAGLIDKGNQPDIADIMKTNNEFNMQQQVAGIQANDTLPVQAPAAKNGLNDITGMKKIEVEKDEIVLRKSGNAFQKVADFKGGKTHDQGGEPYVAAEGDVIFPGKKRLAVNKALRTRDWRGLESMRMKLPKDTPESRKANGVDEVLTDPIDGKVPLKSIAGKPAQPAVHIPVKPGKAGDLLDTQAHYAKTKSLSNEQLEGMKDQQLDHRAYEGRKKDFQRDYLHKWRANPANEKYTALSPEYQTVMAEGKKAWFDENPRMVNKTVADYRDTGGLSPAGLHYAKGEYEEGTQGIKTGEYATGTAAVKTGKGNPDDKWTTGAMRAINEVYPNLSSNAKASLLANIAHETAEGKYSGEIPMKWENLESRTDLKTIKGKVNAYMKKNNLTKDQYDDLPADDRLSIQYQGETGHGLPGGIGALQSTDVSGSKIGSMRKVGKELGAETDNEIKAYVDKGMYESAKFSLKVMQANGITEEKLNNTTDALDMRKTYINPGETDVKSLDSVTKQERKIGKELQLIEQDAKVSAAPVEDRESIMREANAKEMGYESYNSYSQRMKAEGSEPESEGWYKKNVIDPAIEKNQGYWTLDSGKGKKNYDEDNVHRKGVEFKEYLDSLSNKEKVELLKKKLGTKEGDVVAGTQIMTDEEQKSYQKILNFSSDDYLGRDVQHAIDNLFTRHMQNEQEMQDSQYHGFSDPKLKREALAMEDWLGSSSENSGVLGWVGRKGTDLFNTIDQVVGEQVLKGALWNASAQVSTNIANHFSGHSPKKTEELINSAKAKGILSEKGANYVWDVVSNPEVFKNQTQEAVEDINVVMFVKDAPRAIKKILTGGPKLWAKGAKVLAKRGMMKKGRLTAKGIKMLRGSKEFRMELLAAKNAKGSRAAKRHAAAMKDLYGGKYTVGDGATMEEIEKIAKTAREAGVVWDEFKYPTLKSAQRFFNETYQSIKKLPRKMQETFIGTSYDEIAKMEKNLSNMTGKTPRELRAMSAGDLAIQISDTRKAKFGVLQDAIKTKEQLYKTYKPLRDKKIATEKALKALKKLDAPDPEDLKLAEKAFADASVAVADNIEQITDIQKTVSGNWEQIAKIEKWEASPDVAKDFRQLVKAEKAIAKHVDNLEGTDEAFVAAKQAQLNWNAVKETAKGGLIEAQGVAKEGAEVAKKIESAEDVLKLTAKKAAEYQKAAGAQGRARASVNAYETLAKKAPGLHEELKKFPELIKDLNATGRVTPELINILRKQGGGVENLKEEIEPLYTEEDIKEATTPEPTRDVDPAIEGIKKEPVAITTDPSVTVPTSEEVQKELDKRIGDGVVPEKGPSTLKKIGGELSSLAAYAPAVYNIVKGLGSADKVARRYVRPQTMKYENMSQPQMSAIDEAFSAAMGSARNTSGGLMANFRANTEQAWADKIARKGQVHAQEVQRSDQIAGQNIGIRNQAKAQNVAMNQKADIMDAQAQAATDSFLAQGMADIANIGAVKRKDKAAKENQDYMLKMMGAGGKYDPLTGEFTGGGVGRGATTPKEPTPKTQQVDITPDAVVLPEWSLDLSEAEDEQNKLKITRR